MCNHSSPTRISNIWKTPQQGKSKCLTVRVHQDPFPIATAALSCDLSGSWVSGRRLVVAQTCAPSERCGWYARLFCKLAGSVNVFWPHIQHRTVRAWCALRLLPLLNTQKNFEALQPRVIALWLPWTARCILICQFTASCEHDPKLFN
jgi:hypothetical protein